MSRRAEPLLKQDDQGETFEGDVEEIVEEALDSGEDDERAIVCARCEHEVTSEDHKTSIQGGFEHSCANPAGVLYRIGCFEEAPGCGAIGEESSEFTWFEGYAWQVVICRRCREHLGWRYRSSNHVFFGLILPKLDHWEE